MALFSKVFTIHILFQILPLMSKFNYFDLMVHLLTPFGLHIDVPCWFTSLAAMTNISFSKGRIISSCGAKSLDTLFEVLSEL